MHHTDPEEHEHFSEQEIQDFYAEVCRAVDKHADSVDEQYELIDSLPFFTEAWMDTYGVTMSFWNIPEED